MNMSTLLLHKLQADLQSFGLNPTDWLLLPRGGARYEVRHVSDQNFAFLGFLDLQKSRDAWMSLELLSI